MDDGTGIVTLERVYVVGSNALMDDGTGTSQGFGEGVRDRRRNGHEVRDEEGQKVPPRPQQ
jgi:hypothetical protein